MLWRRALARTAAPAPRASLLRASSTHAWAAVEAKWQQRWAADARKPAPTTGSDKPTYYCLSQFPYPSGQLHIGHVRVYTISDTLARLKRMQGYDVLHPMGWDAFGLPAENAAIERGISPADWTVQNIAQAKQQLQSLGIQLDWDREVTTCAEDYYKWTQWIFLQLYEQGLAYRKEALVNWDPVDQTVLANEQVDAEGRSWRSGAIVEQRLLNQWFLRITDYADRLLDDLDRLDKWPDAVKRMQAAWIGRSKGSRVQFGVDAAPATSLPVFTTRVDTLFGVSFVSLAPESPYVDELLPHVPASHRAEVDAYIARVKQLTKDERAKGETTSGVFSGLHAVHPITQQKLPLYLAEYVLPQYGTGVVMGVPAHDERDFAFAQHHALPIQRVIEAPSNDAEGESSEVVTSQGVLQHSGPFTGLQSQDAVTQINAYLQERGLGEETTQFRLRDWLVSRQRYWGAPVPVIHCKQCGPVGVPTEDLPVQLPKMDGSTTDSLKGGDGGSPLARMAAWRECTCPKCGGAAERDTDTLDTFVDSSWYFLRYCDARNDAQAFTREAVDKFMKPGGGVDMYVGGIEHAILHLLYSRFFTKFLFDQKLVATDEPFVQLLAQGMVLGKTYKAPGSLRYLKPGEYALDEATGRMVEVATGKEAVAVWEKMSKSKFNGVDPEHIRSQHGADVTRLVVLFKAPPAHELEWDEADLAGQSRWLLRIWNLLEHAISAAPSQTNSQEQEEQEQALRLLLHGTIQRVTEALDAHQSFNVAIAELMKLSNALQDARALGGSHVYREALEALVKMLAPLAPHSAAEMFEKLAAAGLVAIDGPVDEVDVHAASWPKFDPTLLASAEVTVVLQVQGKSRDTVRVPAARQGDRDHVLALALASPAVQKHLAGKTVRKAILVAPKKQGAHGLLNIVAN